MPQLSVRFWITLSVCVIILLCLGCDCNGLQLSRIIDPPKCNGRLCGIEVRLGMHDECMTNA